MTMLKREDQSLSPNLALSKLDLRILDHLNPDKKITKDTLSKYILKIAKLSGYLARSSDPPPGYNVLLRGYSV